MFLEWLVKRSKVVCVGDYAQTFEYKLWIFKLRFYRDTVSWKLTFFNPKKRSRHGNVRHVQKKTIG